MNAIRICFPFLALIAGIATTRSETQSEWTYERARELWKPMTRGVEHVGVPGYEWQTGVLWNGALFFGPEVDSRGTAGMHEEATRLGDNTLHISIGYGPEIDFPDRLGAGNVELRQQLDHGYMPLPKVLMQHDGLDWEETVFGRLLGRSMEEGMHPAEDDVLVAFVRLKAVNRSAKQGKRQRGYRIAVAG
jgi:hypothetical protein